MIYEDTQSKLPSTQLPSWVLCANSTAEKSGYQYRFSGIAYAASVSQMPSLISQFHNKGVGYVYITGALLSSLPSLSSSLTFLHQMEQLAVAHTIRLFLISHKRLQLCARSTNKKCIA
jgi:hypothetical protein